MNDRQIDESELHALVDGELDPARQAEVEAWLSENPEAAGRVARYRAQNAGLHALFDDVLHARVLDGRNVVGDGRGGVLCVAVAKGLCVLRIDGGEAGLVFLDERLAGHAGGGVLIV